MIKNELLFHEIQLGNNLAKSVDDNRRSDFALMLALLSKDVREQSQFYLYETPASDTKYSDARLREELAVAPKARLSVTSPDDLTEFNQAEHLPANQAYIRLSQALNPMPLVIEDDEKKIPEEVMSNVSLDTQERLKAQLPKDISLNDSLDFNVPRWLDSIDAARTAA